MLAERRCRITPLPGAIEFVLLAELLHRNVEQVAAVRAIAQALAIAPDDIFANRKLLAWSSGAEQAEAAFRLIELDREPKITAAAVSVLEKQGITAVARASVIDGKIRGWAAWRLTTPGGELATGGDQGQTIVIEHGSTLDRVRLQPDPKHPLAAVMGAANSFVVSTQIGHGQWLETRTDEGPLRLDRLFTGFAGTEVQIAKSGKPVFKRTRGPRNKPLVTVIVPVYGDLDATRVCLDSLLASLAGERTTDRKRMRVIVVDDASPEAGMADYLATLPVDLLTCPRNLGFVGAVNAALAHVEGGDIVLLNADTVLPAGAIGRLRATAASASDIGTVTPLSNNGELTSMPIPFQENPLPDTSQIARIDAAAAALDGDSIELPTGIGFCLYVTRACLDAVGGLSVHYERGYGEDVHLCLAGREAGFRSVCATSVFVGHAGTRSFGAEKRRLVMRNAARVDARFPAHEHELAAFVTADPLHDIRHAIGGKLIETFEGAILVADNGSLPQAEAHLAELARTGQPALMATCDRGKAIWRAYDGSGALEAETAYALPEDNRSLASRRGKLTAVNVTVFSPEAFFAMAFDKIKCPFDLHICNAGAIANRTGITAAPATSKAWRFSIAAARRIVAPDARAEAFVLSHWPQAGDKMTVPTPTTERHAKAPDANPRRLGVVLLAETAACRRLIGRLGASVPRGADDEPGLLVIGNTADDLRLIRAGGIMMTGKAAPDEIATLARRHRLTHMLALSSTAQFGSPVATAAAALDLPLAQFDWTGAASTATADLWLDFKSDDDVVVATLATWLNEDASAS